MSYNVSFYHCFPSFFCRSFLPLLFRNYIKNSIFHYCVSTFSVLPFRFTLFYFFNLFLSLNLFFIIVSFSFILIILFNFLLYIFYLSFVPFLLLFLHYFIYMSSVSHFCFLYSLFVTRVSNHIPAFSTNPQTQFYTLSC